MKDLHDLSTLSWTLAGWTPYLWQLLKTLELGESPQAEFRGIPASVPGSVQQALRNAGLLPDWQEYWQKDDALFRAETGAPGAAPAEIIRQYAGGFEPFPISEASPVWRRPLTWWIEVDAFKAEHGREPQNLEEYVDWSQARQAEALAAGVGASKARFPRVGGMLLWCGHDCYPCPANTSIIDYHGNPKPAALALQAIWKRGG